MISADESMAKPAPTSSGGNSKWLVLVAVAIVILAGAWYFMQPASPNSNNLNPNGGNNTPYVDPLTTPGAMALLGSFDKLGALPSSYNLSMAEPIDGIDANISLMQQGAARQATITTAYDTRTYYWTGNQTIACEQTGGMPANCANINGSIDLVNYAIRLNATFPTGTDASAQKADQARMIQLGALVFKAPPQARTVAGRNCTDLLYTFDFSHLTPNQLAQIGMNASDPLVTVFSNYKIEKCVDNQMGIALVSSLSYDYVDPSTQRRVTMGDQLTYQTFQAPLAGRITVPAINASLLQLVTATTQVDELLAAIGGCINATNHDQCILSAAGNYKQTGICNQIANESARSNCVVIVATVTDSPKDCPMAGNESDSCYGNIAVQDVNPNYCGMMVNASLRQTCLTLVAQVRNSTYNASASPNTLLPSSTGVPTGNALIPPPNNQSAGGLPTPSGNNSTVPRAAG